MTTTATTTTNITTTTTPTTSTTSATTRTTIITYTTISSTSTITNATTNTASCVLSSNLLPINWHNAPNQVYNAYTTHKYTVSSILDSAYTGPIPTNCWYENFLLNTVEYLQLNPYLARPEPSGFRISAAQQRDMYLTPNNLSFFQTFNSDWEFTSFESFTSMKITSLKQLSVTLNYNAQSGSMQMPLVQGMGLVTAVYTNLTPVLSTVRAILSVQVNNGQKFTQGQTTSSGTKFVVQLNTNAYWVLYTSVPASLQISSGSLKVAAIGTYTIKIGSLGPTDSSNQWDRFAYSFVDSADLCYQVVGDTAYLTYTWNKKGSGDLLMFALPHHVNYLQNPQYVPITAIGIKGLLHGIMGDSWILQIPLSPITWNAPNPIDPKRINDILNALNTDQNLAPAATDPYFFGVDLARSARLALIADQLNQTTIAANIRNKMKNWLIPWLSGTNENPLL